MNDKTAIDPMEGGEVRERTLFWKGETIGDWLIGRLIRFSVRRFTDQPNPVDIAHFTSVAISDGKTWRYVRDAQITLSTALASRISVPADAGRIFAIRFDGFEPSTDAAKKDARLYTVVDQTAAKLKEILAIAEG